MKAALEAEIPRLRKELKEKKEKHKRRLHDRQCLEILDRRLLQQTKRVDKQHIGAFLNGARELFKGKETINLSEFNAIVDQKLPNRYVMNDQDAQIDDDEFVIQDFEDSDLAKMAPKKTVISIDKE